MGAWTWALGEPAPSTRIFRELTAATGRRMTARLDAPWDAQFSIDGRHDEAGQITELVTDLHVWRDGRHLFRGRIGPSSDGIEASTHRCQFSALDYRSMITKHRKVGGSGAYYPPGTDQAAIAWDLIAVSQAMAGGNWGITNGLGSTSSTTRENTLLAGKSIGEAIAEMGQLSNGYEWEIDAELAFNRWYPQRGVSTGVVMDYGGLLSKINRNLGDEFANVAIVTGGPGLVPVTSTTADVATDPKGRMETYAGYPSVVDQATLNAKGPWLRDQSAVVRPSISATFAPGRWEGPSHLWLGDTGRLAVTSGRLKINADHRLVELALQPGDDGTETIVAGLQAVA